MRSIYTILMNLAECTFNFRVAIYCLKEFENDLLSLFFRLCFLQCNANWGIVGAFPEKIPNPVNVKFADKFS